MNRERMNYFPAFGAFLAIVAALYITAVREMPFWAAMHYAHMGYLNATTMTSCITVPIGLVLGIVVSSLARRRAPGAPLRKRLSRAVVGIWLSVVPALHWFACLALFMRASRYSGKAVSILFALLQMMLMGVAIHAGVSVAGGSRHRFRRTCAYLCLALLSSLFLLRQPARGLVLFMCAVVLHLALLALAYVGLRSETTAEDEDTLKPAVRLLPSGRLLQQSFLLSLAALSLLAYLLTSQFDERPTTVKTHALFVLLAGTFVLTAMFPEGRAEQRRTLFWVVATPLWLVELTALISLHEGAERDPVVILGIVEGIMAVGMALTGLLLVMATRRSKNAPVEGACVGGTNETKGSLE
jgi:hypothetical protein